MFSYKCITLFYGKGKVGNSKRGRVSTCMPTSDGSSRGGACEGDPSNDESTSITPLIIIFTSQFVAGIGNLLFFSLGGPYLDDNTARKNMPRVLGICIRFLISVRTFFFKLDIEIIFTKINLLYTLMFQGTTMALRLVGPTLGYLVAFVTLRMYVNPLLTPIIGTDDPRWLGAWWL